jgi:hypothetical protein
MALGRAPVLQIAKTALVFADLGLMVLKFGFILRSSSANSGILSFQSYRLRNVIETRRQK